MSGLSGALAEALHFRRLFGLLPFFMIIGLLVYCSLPVDPHPIALALVAGALAWWLFHSRHELTHFRAASLILAFWAGFSLLGVHGALFGTPMLAFPAFGSYQARVDRVLSASDDGQRIVVSQIEAEDGARSLPVRRARLFVKQAPALAPGDLVQGKFRFAPVPGPVVPGGFDSQFHAYFDGIGAFGNATGPVQLLATPIATGPSRLISHLRSQIGARVDNVLSPPISGIARALTVGDQSRISDATREFMAGAGLAHVLAISGLHLSLVAGGVFFLVRAILALSYGFGQRLVLKKVAAIAGICVALVYLALSGASVSAVRATIMLVLIFGAVLAGRRALTMRNVAIAALFVIVTDPASVFRPSFQLSFAAVVALIGVYELVRVPSTRQNSFWMVGWRFIAGMATTSLIAGIATALFAAYHFQQTAPLGVLGNLAALPLVGFVVLPSALIAVLMMPLGMEAPFLRIMGWGIEQILHIATRVAAWSQSIDGAPLLTPISLIFGLGALASLAFFTNRYKFVGPVLAIPLIIFFALDRPPDILIADSTQAVAVREEGGLALISGRDSFAVRAWQENYMQPIKSKSESVRCDPQGCLIVSPVGFSVALVKERGGFAEDCLAADLVVSRLDAPETCKLLTDVIDAKDLAIGGVHWARWDPGENRFEIRSAIQRFGRAWRIQR